MLKLEFKNAVARDNGYGLEVNGTPLEEIISTALGTKVGTHKAGYGGELQNFISNSCDIMVIIDPHPVEAHIEDDDYEYNSVEALMEDKLNEFKKKDTETDQKK